MAGSVILAGMWERGYSVPITESHLWDVILREFKADLWIMTPVSGIVSAFVKEFPSIRDALDEYRGAYTPVFVDEVGETELSEFKHPKHAMYVFGRLAGTAFHSMKKDGDLSLRIKTPLRRGLLWPHQAAAIVLYNRMSQWQ